MAGGVARGGEKGFAAVSCCDGPLLRWPQGLPCRDPRDGMSLHRLPLQSHQRIPCYRSPGSGRPCPEQTRLGTHGGARHEAVTVVICGALSSCRSKGVRLSREHRADEPLEAGSGCVHSDGLSGLRTCKSRGRSMGARPARVLPGALPLAPPGNSDPPSRLGPRAQQHPKDCWRFCVLHRRGIAQQFSVRGPGVTLPAVAGQGFNPSVSWAVWGGWQPGPG